MRATSLYSYDAFNNITAYCDPVWSHQNGRDWTSPPAPSDSLCPNQSGTTRYTWTPPSSGAEPYGELTQMVTPLGDNTVTFSYNPSSQGGTDYGLPTSVTGTGFTQNDGTNITPQQSFIYDSHGNLVCYNKGAGWSVLQYDGLNRTTAIGDPDDNALSGAACGKTTGKYATASYTTYYPNGEIKTTQSPSEVAAGIATSFTYDADGNQASITKHFGGTAGTTNKYYDGLERLVEVAQPADPTDEYPTIPWLTRYFYDLTAGGNVSIVYGPSFKAYGNLFKSQEWMGSYSGWVDEDGTAYDALDRVTTRYSYPPSNNGNCQSASTYASCTTTPTAKTNQFDAAADSIGLLTSTTNALGEKTSVNYNSLGNATVVNFGGDGGVTPARTYAYDPDGRLATIYSARFGTQGYTYDADGRKLTSTEPSGGGVTSPATLTYSYYANGQRSGLSISSSALTQANLMAYSYRADGPLQTLKFSYPSPAYSGTFAWTYTAAGRLSGRSDPSGQPAYAYTYDSHGQLSQYAIPAGTYSSIAHDAEGAIASFGGYVYKSPDPPYTQYPETVTYATNVRGEMVKNFYQYNGTLDGSQPNSQEHGAFGYMFKDMWGLYGSDAFSDTGDRSDLRSGASVVSILPGNYSLKWGWQGYYQGAYWYDGAGRQVSGSVSQQSYTLSRQYDAENHLIGQTNCGWPVAPSSRSYASLGYAWGPNGHPAMIGSSPQGTTCPAPAISSWETLHWDGDTLLFTTTQSGAVDDVKIGMMADYTPTDTNYAGLTMWDRDMGGIIASTHNSTGYGLWVGNSSHRWNWRGLAVIQPGGTEKAPNGFTSGANFGQGGLLFERATDGYSDIYNVIQGVRAYDPQLGGWTSPDAYAGNVHDPASQKPYMYNRNNPFSYLDPSGFDVFLAFDPDGALWFGHAFMIVFDPSSLVGDLWSYGPAHELPLDQAHVTHDPRRIDQMKWNNQRIYGFHIQTSPQQDRIMNAFWNSLNQNPGAYVFGVRDCISQVAASLQAAGLNSLARMFTIDPQQTMDALIENGFQPVSLDQIQSQLQPADYSGWAGQGIGGWPHGGPL